MADNMVIILSNPHTVPTVSVLYMLNSFEFIKFCVLTHVRECKQLTGTVKQDFLLHVFFHKSNPPGESISRGLILRGVSVVHIIDDRIEKSIKGRRIGHNLC